MRLLYYMLRIDWQSIYFKNNKIMKYVDTLKIILYSQKYMFIVAFYADINIT